MNCLRTFCVAALLGSAGGLSAQAAPMSAMASAIDSEITTQEKQLVDAVEALPADRFNFTPESLDLPGGDFKGVRTFAAQVKHVAADNFAIWAPLAGKPEPAGLNAPNGPPEMQSRAEILTFLKESFAYAHAAAHGLTAENLLQPVEFRGSKVTRLSLVILGLTHVSVHYGHLAENLRMNGVIPPASRPMNMPMPMPPKPAGT